MKLYLIRHGESLFNKKRRIQGHMDIPLSPMGMEQAGAAGEIIARNMAEESLTMEAACSSDLTRARQTTGQILSRLCSEGDKPIVHYREDLREIMLGEWEGKTREELCSQLEEDGISLFQKWIEDPINILPPGAESMPDFYQRAISAVSEIIRKHSNVGNCDGKAILIVSHGGVLSMLRNYINGRTPADFIMFAHPNAGGFALDYDCEKIKPGEPAFKPEYIKGFKKIGPDGGDIL